MCGANRFPRFSYNIGISRSNSGESSNVSCSPAKKFSGENVFFVMKTSNDFANKSNFLGALKDKENTIRNTNLCVNANYGSVFLYTI